jgi:hypothetical protein
MCTWKGIFFEAHVLRRSRVWGDLTYFWGAGLGRGWGGGGEVNQTGGAGKGLECRLFEAGGEFFACIVSMHT